MKRSGLIILNDKNKKTLRVKLIITTLFIGLILSQQVIASGTLSGIVIDKDKNIPLSGVNVILENTNIGTSTDDGGRFNIARIEPGQYTILFSIVGYERKIISVDILEDETIDLNIQLPLVVLQLSNITITGQANRNLIKSPQIESAGLELSTTVVSRQEIERQGSKTIVEALNFIPSSLIETRGRKVKQFFSVRGQTYPYPEYLINGVWQREFLETSYFFPSTNIERIEVVRSSAALLTGLNGMAGTINIIPREYSSPETSISLEYGSFGTYRSNISNGAKLGSLSYYAGLGFNHSDGPHALHAKEDMVNFNASLKWLPSDELTIRYYLFHINGDRELRLAKFPADERFLTELGSYDPIRSTLTNLKIDYQISEKSKTELLLYYTQRDPIYIDEDEITHEISRFLEKDWELGLNVIQSTKLSDQNTLRIGGHYNHWAAPNGKRFYYGKRNDLETISFVAVDEHSFGPLNLDLGLRWARTYINEFGGFGINGSGKGFSKVEPLTNIWQPSIVHANFGGSYLLPKFYSLNFHITMGEIKPLPGALDIDFNEPNNETRLKFDLGVRKIWNTIGQISVSGFLVYQNDAIVLSGETYDSPSRYMPLYLNRDQNQYGLEVEARFTKIFNTFDFFYNATIMKSMSKKDDKMTENLELPKFISAGGLYYQGKNIDLSILAKYVSSFENIRFVAKDLPPQPLGKYLTLDAILGWTTLSNLYPTRFYLELKNISDVRYSTVVGYPDFGRTISVGIRQVMKYN